MALNIGLTMPSNENVTLNTSGVQEYAPIQHYHASLGDSTNTVLSVDTSTLSVVEGGGTIASGYCAHAEGVLTKATGNQSHSEGASTKATGGQSHSEGASTTASGAQSHAEGVTTTASGNQAHSEGNFTQATGDQSHVEGNNNTASGLCSHAEGYNTLASSPYQHVQGKLNEEDRDGVYAHIVGGGGRGMYWRRNIHTIDWDGNAMFAGGITFYDSNGNEHTLDEILERLTALES